ncbi:MAG: smalltalk protein [Bacteroidaceae bacterium]|nr:smalltalk protein [Bacteroidaceae bacterium]
MKESTKRTLRRISEIVITVLTALLTTLGAHAAIWPL